MLQVYIIITALKVSLNRSVRGETLRRSGRPGLTQNPVKYAQHLWAKCLQGKLGLSRAFSKGTVGARLTRFRDRLLLYSSTKPACLAYLETRIDSSSGLCFLHNSPENVNQARWSFRAHWFLRLLLFWFVLMMYATLQALLHCDLLKLFDGSQEVLMREHGLRR